MIKRTLLFSIAAIMSTSAFADNHEDADAAPQAHAVWLNLWACPACS